VIPVFPLDGVLLLPGGQLPLNIFEPRYLNMLDDVMAGERMIGMIQTRARRRARAAQSWRPIGCAGRVTSFAETSDGRYLITLTGVCRFRAGDELPVRTPYRQVRADFTTPSRPTCARASPPTSTGEPFLLGPAPLSRPPRPGHRLDQRRGRPARRPDQQPVDGPAVRRRRRSRPCSRPRPWPTAARP
jgi:hypothetical protein